MTPDELAADQTLMAEIRERNDRAEKIARFRARREEIGRELEAMHDAGTLRQPHSSMLTYKAQRLSAESIACLRELIAINRSV